MNDLKKDLLLTLKLPQRRSFNGRRFTFQFIMGPTGKTRGPLSEAHVGRHPGHTMGHSTTAKSRGLLLPG